MQKLDIFIEENYKKLFWGLIALCGVLYLPFIFKQFLWMDETYSIGMIRRSFKDIWFITAADVHPPLYYWYLKIFTFPFGYNFAFCRLASVVPYMLIIIFGGIEVNKLFGKKTSILFMGLFFCFPFLMNYSVEIRMYSLGASFVFFCGIFAYEFYLSNKTKYGLLYTLFGVLAAYTHYFAFVSVCVIYALLLIFILATDKKSFFKWLIFVGVSLLLYSPWMTFFVKQLIFKVENEYWIGPITLRTFFSYVNTIFSAEGLKFFSVFVAFAYLCSFVILLLKKDKKTLLGCVACLLIPVLTLFLGVLVSVIVRPVFTIRYLVPSVPFLVLYLSVVLGKIDNEIFFSNILMISLLAGMSNYACSIKNYINLKNYIPLENCKDVESFIFEDLTDCHTMITFGYYETKRPIFGVIKWSDAKYNPFLNMNYIDNFFENNYKKALVFVPVNEKVSERYKEDFDINYIGTWKIEYETDAYLITRKQEK